MSEQTSDTSTIDDQTGDEQQPGTGEQQQSQPRDRSAQREQRLRARARDAETERDALRARADEADAREVARLAGEHLADGRDLALVADLASLRDESGAVDPEKVRAAALDALSKRPHWAPREERGDGVRRQPRGERPDGVEPGRRRGLDRGTSSGASWTDVITPRGKKIDR